MKVAVMSHSESSYSPSFTSTLSPPRLTLLPKTHSPPQDSHSSPRLRLALLPTLLPKTCSPRKSLNKRSLGKNKIQPGPPASECRGTTSAAGPGPPASAEGPGPPTSAEGPGPQASECRGTRTTNQCRGTRTTNQCRGTRTTSQ
jgi:hypothetical protein